MDIFLCLPKDEVIFLWPWNLARDGICSISTPWQDQTKAVPAATGCPIMKQMFNIDDSGKFSNQPKPACTFVCIHETNQIVD